MPESTSETRAISTAQERSSAARAAGRRPRWTFHAATAHPAVERDVVTTLGVTLGAEQALQFAQQARVELRVAERAGPLGALFGGRGSHSAIMLAERHRTLGTRGSRPSTTNPPGTMPLVVDRGSGSQPLNDALALVAPGTALREGLDRILQAKHGALIIVGDDPAVLSVCTGGFLLDAEFTPQRLSELAKMDGAIILAGDASRIARANVHLVPKSTIPTSETGTCHRTAERVARSIDVPVIAVSEAMATIAVYRHDMKHTTQSAGWLIDRSSQALATLQRFRIRFDDALSALSRLEMENAVSVRDVVSVLQPGEMVRRIADEIEGHLVELGSDGRLIHLQTEELRAGVDEAVSLVLADYSDDKGTRAPALAVARRTHGPAQGGGHPQHAGLTRPIAVRVGAAGLPPTAPPASPFRCAHRTAGDALRHAARGAHGQRGGA